MGDNAEIKLVLETAEARKKLDRFRDDLRDTGKAASMATSGGPGGGMARQLGGAAAQSAFLGVTSAISTPGGGGADALLNGMLALGKVMEVEGSRIAAASAATGDVTGAAKGGAQALLGAGISRGVSPALRAREEAIGQAAGLTAGFARVGNPVSDATMAALVQQLQTIATRGQENTIAARRAAGSTGLFDFIR